MVGSMGRQLYLRHILGAVGSARDRRRYEGAVDSNARVAWLQVQAELGRRMGREPARRQGSALKARTGTSTASQTAWAMMGLIAGEDEISDSVTRGVAWLLERQNDAGAWEETEFTGTGFPNHFYLRYHMYAHYFPLMALGRFTSSALARNTPAR